MMKKGLSRAAGGKVSGNTATARKPAGNKPMAKKAATGKPAAKTATHILSAPKGPRTLTHRSIKRAVEKVFAERYGTNA